MRGHTENIRLVKSIGTPILIHSGKHGIAPPEHQIMMTG